MSLFLLILLFLFLFDCDICRFFNFDILLLVSILKLPHISHHLVALLVLIFMSKPESFLINRRHTERFPKSLFNNAKRQVIQLECRFLSMQILKDVHKSLLIIKRLQLFLFYLSKLYELLNDVGHAY